MKTCTINSWAVLGSVLIAVLALHSNAYSAPTSESRVLIVYANERPAVVPMLQGELQSRGFTTAVEQVVSATPNPIDLTARGHARGALAVLMLQPADQGTSVWVIDLLTRKTLTRVLKQTLSEDDGLLARRAVELLRASLLEVAVVPVAQLATAPPAAVTRLARMPPSRVGPWSMQLGPSVTWGRGGLPATAQLDLEVRLRVSSLVSVTGLSRIPVLSAELHEPEGSGEVSALWNAAGVQFQWMPPGRKWELSAGVFAGVTLLKVVGRGTAPNHGLSSSKWLAMAGLTMGGSWSLTRRLSVSMQTEIARTASRVAFQFVDRDVASWGNPTLTGRVALRLSL